jgi:hypothetical protein
MIGHNTGRVLKSVVLISYYCIFVLALVPGRSQVIALRRSYCDDCSHSCFYYCSYYKNIILVCCFSLVVSLVPGRSQVIALRGSYNDGCRRKHIRWSLAETWSRLSRHRVVYMTVHIPVTKEKRTKSEPSGKKGTFVSHIEIDCKEQKAPKMTVQIPLVQLITLQIIGKSQ